MQTLTSSEIFQILFAVISGLITVLLWGNIFFLKKLVHKVDLIDALVINVGTMAKHLDELVGRVEGLTDLKIEVAALKARFLGQLTRHGGNGEIVEEEDGKL